MGKIPKSVRTMLNTCWSIRSSGSKRELSKSKTPWKKITSLKPANKTSIKKSRSIKMSFQKLKPNLSKKKIGMKKQTPNPTWKKLWEQYCMLSCTSKCRTKILWRRGWSSSCLSWSRKETILKSKHRKNSKRPWRKGSHQRSEDWCGNNS